jgi:riboflavin kinase/FMN adenylyltransferase
MKRFDSLDDLPKDFPDRPVCLAIGVFDGLHLGHRALVDRAIESARERGALSAVLTFKRHPLALLAPPYEPPRLIALERRREILERQGLDLLIEIEFTKAFARVKADEFARDILAKRLKVVEVACGTTHRFGYRGEGDPAMLEALGRELGFAVWKAPTARLGSADVSSTAIRDSLLRGRVEEAREALARPYEWRGRVVEGDRRGRLLGFPTANLEPIERLLTPGRGVYACRAEIPAAQGKRGEATQLWDAMINIGSRPTFDGSREVVEAHLLDFQGDLYGREVWLRFLRRLRDERRFEGPEAIKAQLAEDARQTRDALAAEDSRVEREGG